MSTEMLRQHVSFLDELDSAIEQALNYFGDAKPGDIEELKEMRRQVADAKGSVCRAIEAESAENKSDSAAVAAGS